LKKPKAKLQIDESKSAQSSDDCHIKHKGDILHLNSLREEETVYFLRLYLRLKNIMIINPIPHGGGLNPTPPSQFFKMLR
jgi:hypothetical protein